jgi:hypothetical protein
MASLICRKDENEEEEEESKKKTLVGASSPLRLLTINDVEIREHEKNVPSASPYAVGRLGFGNCGPPRNIIASEVRNVTAIWDTYFESLTDFECKREAFASSHSRLVHWHTDQ